METYYAPGSQVSAFSYHPATWNMTHVPKKLPNNAMPTTAILLGIPMYFSGTATLLTIRLGAFIRSYATCRMLES